MHVKNYIALITLGASLSACMSAKEHRQDVADCEGPSTFTLGKVQSSICNGMGQDQVLVQLGAPNIVTTDDNGHETWVYDKVSSEGSHSSSSAAGGFILFGGQKNAGAYETSQKTLTVILNFDHRKKVSAINYHQSKF